MIADMGGEFRYCTVNSKVKAVLHCETVGLSWR